mmetsp:Transcript_22994/g.42182  ORF Transcript_22994/g.42182 Transcript_22994/m.42182 type:complete len:354 (+) Transcript_22994:153-1214(+)
MARLFLPLLLAITHRGNDGGFASRLPAAQAFAPQALRKGLRKEGSFPNTHHEGANLHRSPPRRIQSPADTSLLRMEHPSSDDDSINASTAVDKTKGLFLPLAGIVSLSLVTLAAFTNHLPGPPIDATAPPPFFAAIPFGVIFSGSCDPYSPSLIYRDLFSTIGAIVAAAIFVKGITYPAKMGKIESRDARKIIHTLSAPLFMLLWPLYSGAYGARVFASIVPLLNTLRLYLAGTDSGSGDETELAGAISRSGDAKEALGGPFVYVLVLLFSTLVFWTDSPIGIVAISNMAIGDGLADLIGRRFGSTNKWSFNKSKSMAGSAAFVAGSFVGSYGLISWLTSMGAMDPLEVDQWD